MSKPALWATRTLPRANSRNAGSTVSIRGAWATMLSEMPVSTWMNAGIEDPGLTRVWNSPSTSPPRTLTAPTSVIAHSWALPPVVSRSTTTKVTSRRGVPRSSRVAWTARMSLTLGPGSDSPAQARAAEGLSDPCRSVGDDPDGASTSVAHRSEKEPNE